MAHDVELVADRSSNKLCRLEVDRAPLVESKIDYMHICLNSYGHLVIY